MKAAKSVRQVVMEVSLRSISIRSVYPRFSRNARLALCSLLRA